MTATPVIIVHDAEQAAAALTAAAATGSAVILASAPGAAGYAGAGWWTALVARARKRVPGAGGQSVLDCGDAAGLALAALRQGVTAIAVSSSLPSYPALAEIAARRGSRLVDLNRPTLDLAGVQDAVRTSRDFLLATRPDARSENAGFRTDTGTE